MFNPISLIERKALKRDGKILISVASKWAGTSNLEAIPHNIRYVVEKNGKIYDDVLLYTCYVTTLPTRLLFKDLKRSSFMNNSFYSSEKRTYHLLRMVLDQLITWSTKAEKKHIVIISDLPHIAEHFVDLKFIIKKKSDKIIVGKKTLEGCHEN